MLDNNKCILIFGFSEEESVIVNGILQQQNLSDIKIITDTMTSMKLRDIIEGFKIEVVGKKLPEEKVIIFNNLSDDELDRAVKSIRSSMEIRPILAVVTPTSIDWTFSDLLEHLIEEREFFLEKQKRGK